MASFIPKANGGVIEFSRSISEWIDKVESGVEEVVAGTIINTDRKSTRLNSSHRR